LPKVLQGENQTPPSMQEVATRGLETGGSNEQDAQGNLKKIEVLTSKGDTALSNPLGDQAKAQFEDLIKKGTRYITIHTKQTSYQNRRATTVHRNRYPYYVFNTFTVNSGESKS
jgi:hypothetical protein